MLPLYKSVHHHAGRWLQPGCQRDKLRKYADYEDMVVAGEYSDEGFSGKNIQGRPEFRRMLNDIQESKDGVSYVLVFKLSRFGRNAADVPNSLQLMQDFGVNLICVEDGIDSSKDAGMTNNMISWWKSSLRSMSCKVKFAVSGRRKSPVTISIGCSWPSMRFTTPLPKLSGRNL